MDTPLAIDAGETVGTMLMIVAAIGLVYAMSWPFVADRSPAARRRRVTRNRAIVRYLLGWPTSTPPAPVPLIVDAGDRWLTVADARHVTIITKAVAYDPAFDAKLDALMGSEV